MKKIANFLLKALRILFDDRVLLMVAGSNISISIAAMCEGDASGAGLLAISLALATLCYRDLSRRMSA